MMKFKNAKYNQNGSFDVDVQLEDEGEWFPYTASAEDSPVMLALTQWFAETNPIIAPYIPPPEPTPEELRAQMPTLTRRQFWLAAHDLGVTKNMVLAFTADNLPLQIEVEESTEFHRTYEAVTILAPLLGITDEQLDDIWMWAAVA